ncbi:MAG: hypothetical protein Q9170_003341 [Blastenia crenularia]
MVELRKRREAPSDVVEPPTKKTTSTKAEVTSTLASPSTGSASKENSIRVGNVIDLEEFGGEVETESGEKTDLKKLVQESKNGVVIFTYPKASTPGSTGYSIFGLSTDSPKSNATFKAKQNLPYTLLCDPTASLISAIGMKKAPKGTTRGVFVVSKTGKVEIAEAGGPAATLEAVRKLVQDQDAGNIAETGNGHRVIEADETEPSSTALPGDGNTDSGRADVAAEVADSAEMLDEDARVWDRIRRILAVDPNRSSGIPLNPQYRNPPPGANPPEAYDDPVTVPSGDIAENAYFRRDIRRSYPRLSVVKQGDVVGLLSVGSKAQPKDDILQIGDAGAKQLVQVKQEAEERGLAALFEKEKTSVASILGANGMPPFPTGASRVSAQGGRKYVMDADRENGYPEEPGGATAQFSTHYISRATLLQHPRLLGARGLSMAASSALQPSIADFVLNCSICQETISAIYANLDSNDGLCTGTDHTDGSITKLWLTECAHIVCSKHLKGGDESVKMLYRIQGVVKGAFDENIPAEYLQVPAPQLGDPGNEAVRFQFVSLLRFASRVHERLLVTEKDLNAWKGRESSIVACLAASEPLGRALRLARQQLFGLGGETSFIDEALHHASSLAGNVSLHKSKPSFSTVDGRATPFGDPKPHAGSLLARGSAADFQILQKNILSTHPQELLQSAKVHKDEGHRPLKRKRPEPVHNSAVLYPQRPHRPDTEASQQRVQNSEIMPPPPWPFQDTTWKNSSRPIPLRRQLYMDRSPSNSGHFSQTSQADAHRHSNARLPTYLKTSMISEDMSHNAYETKAPMCAGFPIVRQITDCEMDRNFSFCAPSHSGSRPSGLSPNRLMLPPSTPSIVPRATPRLIGMSANVRTSKPAFPTPESLNILHRNVAYRASGNNHGPGPSPYFGNQSLPVTPAAPSRLTDRPSFSMDRQSLTKHPAVDPPVLAPTASTSWKQLPWLTAPFDHGQNLGQDQQKSVNAGPQNGSGAFRQPGTRHHVKTQRPSINSFLFTNESHVEGVGIERSSRAAFSSPERRAVRR